MPAVTIDESRILAIDVQGLAHFSVAKQGERGILMIDERIDR